MNYSINQLTTVADCDAVLAQVQKQKDDLTYAKTTRERQLAIYGERTVATDDSLLAVISEISALQAVVAGLPEGSVKEDMERKIRRLEYRESLLSDRSEDYDIAALLDRELDVALIDAELAEIDTFMADVETHKATL